MSACLHLCHHCWHWVTLEIPTPPLRRRIGVSCWRCGHDLLWGYPRPILDTQCLYMFVPMVFDDVWAGDGHRCSSTSSNGVLYGLYILSVR